MKKEGGEKREEREREVKFVWSGQQTNIMRVQKKIENQERESNNEDKHCKKREKNLQKKERKKVSIKKANFGEGTNCCCCCCLT